MNKNKQFLFLLIRKLIALMKNAKARLFTFDLCSNQTVLDILKKSNVKNSNIIVSGYN